MKISHPKITDERSATSLSRKSSSVRNYRGRKYTVQGDSDVKQKYFGNTRVGGAQTSNYLTNHDSSNNYTSGQTSVNNTVAYYNKSSKLFPRSKTNSKKRGTVILRGKDSRNIPVGNQQANIRPNRSSIKRTPLGYANQTRAKSTNNRSNLKERIKTIEYNDANNFKSLVARSNTVQRRRKIPANNFGTNESIQKPYSNFMPSTNTRSNITIDRSGSMGYGRLGLGTENPSSISHYDTKDSKSRKAIAPINEYEDDTIQTINSNSFGKRSNLNAILGIKNNNDCNLTINTYQSKTSSKELPTKPKFNKVSKADGTRSKSNKRSIKDNFERVYMQSPCKLIRQPNQVPKLRKNITTHESHGSLNEKGVNLRDNSVSPSMPKIKDAISREPRHKTTIKERSAQHFNNSMKHETSSIATSKDNSKIHNLAIKHAVSCLFLCPF